MHLPTSMIIAGAAIALALLAMLVFRLDRRGRRAAREALRDLGFVPVPPSPEFTARIGELYARIRPDAPRHSLHDVYTQRLQGADVFVFDLVDDSDEDSSFTEKQAIAVVSDRLRMPVFVVLPRVDSDAAIAGMANRVITMMARSFGEPVEFPNATEFNRHGLVSSPDPDGTRRFLDGERLHRLAAIGYHSVRAGGGVLVVSRNLGTAKPLTRERLREHLDHALNLLTAFAD